MWKMGISPLSDQTPRTFPQTLFSWQDVAAFTAWMALAGAVKGFSSLSSVAWRSQSRGFASRLAQPLGSEVWRMGMFPPLSRYDSRILKLP